MKIEVFRVLENGKQRVYSKEIPVKSKSFGISIPYAEFYTDDGRYLVSVDAGGMANDKFFEIKGPDGEYKPVKGEMIPQTIVSNALYPQLMMLLIGMIAALSVRNYMHPRKWSLPLDYVVVSCGVFVFAAGMSQGQTEIIIRGMIIAGVGFMILMAREHNPIVDSLFMRSSPIHDFIYMENERNNENEGWPPSNYAIFLALVLLAATAVTLAMGDEKRAEELAIYAYYLLVIGVVIRFFELSLPENTLVKLGVVKVRFLGWMMGLVQTIWDFNRVIGIKLRLLEVRIPDFGLPGVRLPEVRLPEFKISNVHREGLKNSIAYVSELSKNITVFLSLALLILLIYGLMIDWWTAKGYFTNFVLVILGLFTVYFFTKQLAGRMWGK